MFNTHALPKGGAPFEYRLADGCDNFGESGGEGGGGGGRWGSRGRAGRDEQMSVPTDIRQNGQHVVGVEYGFLKKVFPPFANFRSWLGTWAPKAPRKQMGDCGRGSKTFSRDVCAVKDQNFLENSDVHEIIDRHPHPHPDPLGLLGTPPPPGSENFGSSGWGLGLCAGSDPGRPPRTPRPGLHWAIDLPTLIPVSCRATMRVTSGALRYCNWLVHKRRVRPFRAPVTTCAKRDTRAGPRATDNTVFGGDCGGRYGLEPRGNGLRGCCVRNVREGSGVARYLHRDSGPFGIVQRLYTDRENRRRTAIVKELCSGCKGAGKEMERPGALSTGNGGGVRCSPLPPPPPPRHPPQKNPSETDPWALEVTRTRNSAKKMIIRVLELARRGGSEIIICHVFVANVFDPFSMLNEISGAFGATAHQNSLIVLSIEAFSGTSPSTSFGGLY